MASPWRQNGKLSHRNRGTTAGPAWRRPPRGGRVSRLLYAGLLSRAERRTEGGATPSARGARGGGLGRAISRRGGGVSASSHSASCFRGGRAGEGKPLEHDGNLFPDRDSTISR